MDNADTQNLDAFHDSMTLVSAVAASLLLFFWMFPRISSQADGRKNSVSSHFCIESLLSNESCSAIKLLLILPIAGGYAAIAARAPRLFHSLANEMYGDRKFSIDGIDHKVSDIINRTPIELSSLLFLSLTLYFFRDYLQVWLIRYRDWILEKAKLYERIDRVSMEYARRILTCHHNDLDGIENMFQRLFGRCVYTEQLVEIKDKEHILAYKIIWYSRGDIQKYGYINGLASTLNSIGVEMKEQVVWFPRIVDVLRCILTSCLLVMLYVGFVPTLHHFAISKGFAWPDGNNSALLFQTLWGFAIIEMPIIIGFFVFYYSLKFNRRELRLNLLGLELINATIIGFSTSLLNNTMFLISNMIGSHFNKGGIKYDFLDSRLISDLFLTSSTCIVAMIVWFFVHSLHLRAYYKHVIANVAFCLSIGLWLMFVRAIYEAKIDWDFLAKQCKNVIAQAVRGSGISARVRRIACRAWTPRRLAVSMTERTSA